MKKFVVYSRYEWYSASGITWSRWSPSLLSPLCDDENDEALFKYKKELMDLSASIDKSTKRKSEYKIDSFDYNPENYKVKKEPEEKSVKKGKKKDKKD